MILAARTQRQTAKRRISLGGKNWKKKTRIIIPTINYYSKNEEKWRPELPSK